ncbi:MAG: hypothetical protein WCT04_01495 [Planctomycetota bacterium]
MSIDIINAFVEGRGSLASLERAIEESSNPLQARAELECELAAEWALKSLFTTIPPPVVGLPRVMAALRSAPAPVCSSEQVNAMENLRAPLNESLSKIPEPAGGYAAAIARVKSKLATAPSPARKADMDITPDMSALSATIEEFKKPRRVTRKIVRMSHVTRHRDVLAAGKDLPENPNA